MKTKGFRSVFLPLLIFLVLIAGASAQEMGSGPSGSQPQLSPAAKAETPASTKEAQALRDGYELVPSGEQVVGNTGKPGLGGTSGSQAQFLPAAKAETPASTREAQALRDGYELVPSGEQVVGNTGKPGLGGTSGSQAQFLPAARAGEAASNTKHK